MSITTNRNNPENVVVAFDFDGTLTTNDTLIAFIRFTHGLPRLLVGLLCHLHLLLLLRMGLYPNGKAKEKIFSHFYKGMAHGQFTQLGRDFADVAETMLNHRTVSVLRRHLAAGHTVCVVTASIGEWVRPVCERLGVSTVIATRVDVSAEGILTGRFHSPNCYGPEKVVRLLEAFPQRQNYKLYVYGDSRGDDELLALADEGIQVNNV